MSLTDDTLERIASALERLATTHEKAFENGILYIQGTDDHFTNTLVVELSNQGDPLHVREVDDNGID